jgi:hypothetical protein
MSERFVALTVLGAVLFAGCAGHRTVSVSGDQSASAEWATEVALAQAVGAMDLPEGEGTRLRLEVTGPETVRDSAQRIVADALIGRDYRLTDDAPTVMTVRVDSGSAANAGAGGSGSSTQRASARLHAVIVAADGSSQTYTGAGVVQSAINERATGVPGSMNRSLKRGSRAGVLRAVKPVIITVALTVMAWALYSYRG